MLRKCLNWYVVVPKGNKTTNSTRTRSLLTKLTRVGCHRNEWTAEFFFVLLAAGLILCCVSQCGRCVFFFLFWVVVFFFVDVGEGFAAAGGF